MSARSKAVSLPDLQFLRFDPTADAAGKKKGAAGEAARPVGETMLQHTTHNRVLQSISDQITVLSDEHTMADDWLNTRIRKGRAGVFSEVVNLTPDLARALLRRNRENRRVREDAVERYRSDIAEGRWPLNGQTMVVSDEGDLNDGQHRCLGVIAAGAPAPVIIVFGVERETRFTLDQNGPRTNSDIFMMNGLEAPGLAPTVAGYIWQYQNLNRISQQRSDKALRAEVLQIGREYNDEIVNHIRNTPNRGSKLLGGRALLVFMRLIISRRAGERDAGAFIERLMVGDKLDRGSPVLLLKTRLTENRGRMKVGERAELIIRAWNALRRGERPTHFKLHSDNKLPAIER